MPDARALLQARPGRDVTPAREYVAAILSTAAVTLGLLTIEPLTGHRPLGLLYLLLIVAVGMKLRRGPVLLVAASSAFLWALFIPPRFYPHISDPEDLMLFATFFAVALTMAHLTSRLRQAQIIQA